MAELNAHPMQENPPAAMSSETGDPWVAGAEAALGGVLIGGILGLLASGTAVLFGSYAYIAMVINDAPGPKGINVTLNVFFLLCGLALAVVTLILGGGIGVISGGFVAGLCGLLTFAILSRWIRPIDWPVINRAHQRGMLAGTVLGVALQPILWWMSIAPQQFGPLIDAVVTAFPDMHNFLPIIAMCVALQIGGAIFAVNALFHLRAGHPGGPWRPLPFPFKEW